MVQLSLAEVSQWSSGLVQPVSQTRGPSWGMGECQGFATHPVNLMVAKGKTLQPFFFFLSSQCKRQLDIPPLDRWDIQHLHLKKSPSLGHLPAKLDCPGGQGVGQASCSDTGIDTLGEARSLTREIKGGGLGLFVDEFSFL